MSRVHCVGCGAAVVVDPPGICPEGHHVGASGARVEAAMGIETAHPDEPERGSAAPWFYSIDDHADATVGARAKGRHDAPPHELRPVRLAGLSPDTLPVPDAADPAPATPAAPSGSDAPSEPAQEDAPPPAPDLSSFTAKGGKGRKAGRKRLFGR